MRHVGVLLAAAVVYASCVALFATPALVQGFKITHGSMNVEVPGDGSGEAEFTIREPDFTGDIEINLEDITLQYEPKMVAVDEGVNKKVVVTFYGDESRGSSDFTGRITFVPRSEAMFVAGYKIRISITHRVAGVPVDPTPTPPEYFLSVSTEPDGSGSVTADPPEGPYASGTEVTLTAVPAAGYAFDHWSGNVSGTDPEVTIDGSVCNLLKNLASVTSS